MAIYYLDIFDGVELIRDDEGQEIDDLVAVSREAEAAVRELVVNTISRHEAIDDRQLRVRDERGCNVFILRSQRRSTLDARY